MREIMSSPRGHKMRMQAAPRVSLWLKPWRYRLTGGGSGTRTLVSMPPRSRGGTDPTSHKTTDEWMKRSPLPDFRIIVNARTVEPNPGPQFSNPKLNCASSGSSHPAKQ